MICSFLVASFCFWLFPKETTGNEVVSFCLFKKKEKTKVVSTNSASRGQSFELHYTQGHTHTHTLVTNNKNTHVQYCSQCIRCNTCLVFSKISVGCPIWKVIIHFLISWITCETWPNQNQTFKGLSSNFQTFQMFSFSTETFFFETFKTN